MGAPNLTDATFAAFAPATDTAAGQSLDLTTSNANIALACGVFELHLEASSGLAFARLGSEPTIPSSGGAAETGFWIAPGVPRSLVLDDNGTLHAKMTAGTGTLRITRLR